MCKIKVKHTTGRAVRSAGKKTGPIQFEQVWLKSGQTHKRKMKN
jgi:hypothetical protein